MAISDLAFLGSSSVQFNPNAAVPDMIHILRKHLDMDIAFVGEFLNGVREIKIVDTDEENCPVKSGHCTPAEESYCKLIIDGKLPGIINDVAHFPLLTTLPVTKELDIKSYIAAPIHLSDGSIYGTLCCYSHTPEPSLNKRDLSMMRACAEMTAKQIEKQLDATSAYRKAHARIQAILASDGLQTLYQPIIELSQHRIVGFEALSRFASDTGLRPDIVFNEAHSVGLGCALEMKAVTRALEGLERFACDTYISVNVAPDTVLNAGFSHLFSNMSLDRITLEITEHAAVERYQEIKSALAPLRRDGMRLAVDDAGAGFSSFRHILELEPDRIKLDWSLTKGVDTDPSRRALVAAFVRFAGDTGSKLIAEGVETATELNALRELGVEKVQGNFLGKPMPLEEALRAARERCFAA